MAASYNFLSSTDSAAGLGHMPHIAEDTLVYAIHLPPAATSSSESSSAPTSPLLASLSSEACLILINEEVQRLLSLGLKPGQTTWIWHKDPWELKVASADAASGGPSTSTTPSRRTLEGRMRIGDSVDDEWLVVWLLKQISKRWPELIISVRDTDGDFLLIEAANSLPKWVTPSNSDNRLWLHNDHLYLLPLTLQSPASHRPPAATDYDDEWSSPSNSYLSIPHALSYLRSASAEAYRAPAELERDVWARIARYPEAMKTHVQTAAAYLPREVARCLSVRPELVQRAVEGFYTRDPAQLRLASKASHFSPKPENTVLVPVQMTRTAYAQLRGQVFHPPKVFGPEWRETAEETGVSEQDTEKKRRDLGVKITIGFEIMYREDGRRSRGKATHADAASLAKDDEYKKFLANLTAAGWFGTDLEGSEGWKAREAKAREGWRMAKASSSENRTSFAELVDDSLATTQDTLQQSLQAMQISEDSDSWLEVDPDELDGMLQAASAGSRTKPDEGDTEMTAQDGAELGDEHAKVLSDLANKVNSFVEGQGDLEGARFEDELSDEDEEMDLGDSDDESDGGDAAMSVDEREQRMQNLVPALDPQEWGRRTENAVQKPTEVNVGHPAGKQVSFADHPGKQNAKASDEPVKMRPPLLAPQEFDGHVVDSDDEESEDEEASGPSSGWGAQSTARLASSGTQSRSELEASIKALADEFTKDTQGKRDVASGRPKQSAAKSAAEEDVDEPEPDMAEEEGDFLEFAREALGISDEMWTGMLDERKARGAYVPTARSPPSRPRGADVPMSFDEHRKANAGKTSSSAGTDKGKAPAEPSGQRNQELDTFDKVMEAMDLELSSRTKPKFRKPSASVSANANASTGTTTKPSKNKGTLPPLPALPTEADLDDMDEDDLAAMDRELKAALKSAGVSDLDSDVDEGMDAEMRDALEGVGEQGRDEYRMMKDFLESYRSQAGQSGVVGNLFGRLGGGGTL